MSAVMFTIRMKTSSAGPKGNRVAGQVYAVTPDEGAELVRGGYAEWVESPALEKPVEQLVEVAVLPEPENAAVRTKPAIKKGR